MTACSVPTCDRPFYARGVCQTHYERLRRGNLRPDVPISTTLVVVHDVAGCGTCGAGDVRPGPCQVWCWTQKVRARRRRRRA